MIAMVNRMAIAKELRYIAPFATLGDASIFLLKASNANKTAPTVKSQTEPKTART